jgi:cyanophycin synthetase
VCDVWGGGERVVVGYENEDVVRAALEHAIGFHDRSRKGLEPAVEDAISALVALRQRVALGPSTRSIVDAAQKRGIPFRRLTSGSLVVFGQGTRQRRILAAETDTTGAIAQEIAKDKEITRALLSAVGAPVPEGRAVVSAEDAWKVAEEIGGPVVIKPQDGNQGQGVATDLRTREQIIAAFEAAREASAIGSVIVERYAPGSDYRVLVVGGNVVAAALREPPAVCGDGERTIRELVAEVNRDPKRGEDHATSLSPIPLDSVSLAVLAEQGYSPDAVPARDATVLIRRNANLSTGGTATDVTDDVHPEVASRCVEAARMVGLDIAGIDVVASDIGRPLEEQGGVIVEVNAAPGLRMHLQPSRGKPRPVGEAIVDLLFPSGQTGRIPIVAVTGTNGKSTVTRVVAQILREAGRSVGMTCTDGIFLNDRRVDPGDCSGPSSAQAVLVNPSIDAAVLETARGGLLRSGLGFDACDVAVVTNIAGGDHLGLADVNTPEELGWVKGTVVASVGARGWAVLNANDPLVVAMARRCAGSLAYFAIDPDHDVVRSHRGKGGRAVIVRHGQIVLAEGGRETGLARLIGVPLTHGGRIGFQAENVLAAVAAAWCLGVDLDSIARVIETLGAEMDGVPGRFNLLEIRGATVVVDYGHNPSALSALVEALEPLPHARRLAVYSAAGDRRDADMMTQGEILARHFDQIFLYEDHYVRGRADGEIMAILRRGIEGTARNCAVFETQGALRAVDRAIRASRPGDLLLIQADTIDETMGFIRQLLAAEAEGREIDWQQATEMAAPRVEAFAGRDGD